MEKELAHANVVVVAQQMNPSVFNPSWLLENEIVAKEEMAREAIFTPQLVSVQAAHFSLLVAPDRLQVALLNPKDEQNAQAVELVGTIVKLLPHTPYTAIGLNMTWLIDPAPAGCGEFVRKLFWVPDNPIYGKFDQDDARCGGYVSKDVSGFRLKLDMKPITVDDPQDPQGKSERLQLAFNFHKDIASGAPGVQDIVAAISKWGEVRAHADEIVGTLGVDEVNT